MSRLVARIKRWLARLFGPALYDWDGEAQTYRPRS